MGEGKQGTSHPLQSQSGRTDTPCGAPVPEVLQIPLLVAVLVGFPDISQTCVQSRDWLRQSPGTDSFLAAAELLQLMNHTETRRVSLMSHTYTRIVSQSAL